MGQGVLSGCIERFTRQEGMGGAREGVGEGGVEGTEETKKESKAR